jgi:hypothetical protein
MQPTTPRVSLFQNAKEKLSSSKSSEVAGTTNAAQPAAGANIDTDKDKPDVVQTSEASVLRPISELWDEAYEVLRRRNETHKLIADYEASCQRVWLGS